MIYFVLFAAKGHIDRRMAADADRIARGEAVEGRYLTYFLSQTKLPMKTIYSNITELLLAGVDTVRSSPRLGSPVFGPSKKKKVETLLVVRCFQISGTLSWTLYELSRHPKIQAEIRKEVLAVLGGRRIPVAADVANMRLLKATVKEVLR